MAAIVKKHIKIGAKRLFVQVLGTGPAIALLHPSPHSSDMLLPLAEKLAASYTVICVDTPGYGRSDKTDCEPENIGFYGNLLHRLFTKLKVSKIALYGSATGAQIAIRFALDYPEMISHLFLDNAAHFEDSLRNRILEDYFPDLSPKKDGSHLKLLWEMVSNINRYFPWCFKTKAYALNRPQLPTVVLHAITIDFLKAGPAYHYAYKAAFYHEKAEHVQELKTNTSIFRWQGSVILKHIDHLLAHELPNHIETVDLPAPNSARMRGMAVHIILKSKQLKPYEFLMDIGDDFVEAHPIEGNLKLPEMTDDGQYLIAAWQHIYLHNEQATPEEIQQLLIDWYTNNPN